MMSFFNKNFRNSFQQLPAQDLASCMAEHGLAMPYLPVPDGSIHRFHVKGDKPGSKNGWVVFYIDPTPVACYGSWKTGQTRIWYQSGRKQLSVSERQELSRSIQKAARQHKEAQQKKYDQAAIEAEELWTSGKDDFGYFRYLDDLKKVDRHGIKKIKHEIVTPLRDIDGKLTSLQFINSDGKKRFLPGGKTKGSFHLLGEVGNMLHILEGYATGASAYEHFGMHLPVAITFYADNLKAVALAFRKKYPDLKIIIIADNDRFTDGNPGLKKAKEAAEAVGGRVYCPEFKDGESGTDFNDWVNLRRNQDGD